MRDTEREAEGEAGFLWGARCGWTLGSALSQKADAQLLSHPGVPKSNSK